ncbi:magnesium and cobalt transport protein CorA [Micrococcus terreus]|uniref:Magnesium transporter n=1 Tax=Micrococcus terreus TaxID=574650 RepID=A0A1I7MQD5_9MICC|nr:magnesium and cobalt transport protein CorA [Micrococcus terreus]SFV24157.1 magnesium transporter [Micrococcus terreus]
MTIIDNAIYRDGKRILAPTTLEETFEAAQETGGMAWIGLYRPDEAEFREVAEELGLHELAVEDALAGSQRAKHEHYGEDRFLVLIPARYIDATETVEFGELAVFMGPHHVITVRHAQEPDLAQVRRKLEQDDPEQLAMGPAGVVHAILDRVVDDYYPVADGLDNDVSEIEDQIFSGDGEVTRRIYELSREVLNFQRAIRSLPAMVEDMMVRAGWDQHGGDRTTDAPEPSDEDTDQVELVRRLRDVRDHALQLNDRVAAMRAMLENALELDSTLASKRLAEVSVAQNEQVKRISSWAAIIFAPQLVGSIYGMNFTHMPELHWVFGYPMALALMLGVALTLFILFRRNDWL